MHISKIPLYGGKGQNMSYESYHEVCNTLS